MPKEFKVTLSDEAAFYLDFLIKDECTRKPSIQIERLIMQAIRKRKVEDRPEYKESDKCAK